VEYWICTGFRAGKQCAQPGVEGEKAEEAEGCARARYDASEGCERGDSAVGNECGCRRFGGLNLDEAQEFARKGRELGGFGL